MIAERYGEKLYMFEKRSGTTGVFSGRELDLLFDYVRTGERTAFVARLFDLRILAPDETASREAILAAGENSIPGDWPRFRALHVELTNRCPLACPQCYKGGGGTYDMRPETFEKLVDEAEGTGVFQIALGGGEPLAYAHLPAAVRLVGRTEMSVTLTTGGRGLTQRLLEDLTDAGLNHVQVSLNSLDREINALSRDGYDDATAALERLSANGVSFGINWTARQDNLSGFGDLVAFAAGLGADNVNILRYKPSGLEGFDDVALSPAQSLTLAGAIGRARGVKIKVDSAYSQLLCLLHGEGVDEEQCGCGAGRTFVAVTPEGAFKPCSHLRMETASESLATYAKSADLAAFLEAAGQLDDLCGSCLHGKRCGGCRAICERRYGRLDAGERECAGYVQILAGL